MLKNVIAPLALWDNLSNVNSSSLIRTLLVQKVTWSTATR